MPFSIKQQPFNRLRNDPGFPRIRQEAAKTAQNGIQGELTSALLDPDSQVKAETQNLFKDQFGALAQDKRAFHGTLRKVFGENYDVATAEKFRQSALKGNFEWLPPVRFASDSALGGAYGAYDAGEGVVYLNESLKDNPALAASTYVEEVGHHLDARLNTQDTVGDEGELFRRVLAGEKLSSSQIDAIRTENDKGVINVNGRQVEVEFFFKKIKKAFKKVGRFFKKGVKTVTGFVGNAAKAVGGLVKKGVKKVGRAIGKGVKAVGGFVKKGFNAVGKVIKKGVNVVGKVLKPIGNVLGKVLKPFGNILGKILPVVLPVLGAIFPPLGALGGVLGGVLGKAGGLLGGVLGKAGGFLGGIAGKVLGPVTNVLGKVLGPVKNVLGRVFRPVQNVLGRVFRPVQNALGRVFQPVRNGLGRIFRPVQNALGRIFRPVRNGLGRIFRPVRNALSRIFRPFTQPLARVARPIADRIRQILRPRSTASTSGLGRYDGVSRQIDKLSSRYDSLLKKLNSGDLSQAELTKLTTELQMVQQKITLLNQFLTNMLKTEHDQNMAIARNLR